MNSINNLEDFEKWCNNSQGDHFENCINCPCYEFECVRKSFEHSYEKFKIYQRKKKLKKLLK